MSSVIYVRQRDSGTCTSNGSLDQREQAWFFKVVQITIQAAKIHEQVSFGYTRFKISAYVGRQRQYTKCHCFGYIASTCQVPLKCRRCAKDHHRAAYTANQPRHPNYKKKAQSTSRGCTTFTTEVGISKCQKEHRIGYVSARLVNNGGVS